MNELVEEQIFHCLNSCEDRIEEGMNNQEAFCSLHEEIARALEGEEVYPPTE